VTETLERPGQTNSATAEFDAAETAFHAGHGLLFVTGRAGTGKSTLLRHLRQRNATKAKRRNLAVLAPTGLAAVRARRSIRFSSCLRAW
jgi:type II secretory ATPase GspE/PulE/Tfp pilus assembly ATPase PilB-like protein